MPKAKIHRRVIEKEIRVGLDPKDREPIVKDLTNHIKEQDELKAEAAEVQSGYRRKQKELKEKIDEAVLTLSQGKPEMVEVEEIKNFTKETVTYKRTDTGATVEKRAMTNEDKQLDLGAEADEDTAKEGDEGEPANPD